MLTPCKPCICPKAPCEQCTFGYRPAEENHNQMKRLIELVDAGEKPCWYLLVNDYKRIHPNWKDRMEE